MADELTVEIVALGDKVRQLKASGAEEARVTVEVGKLLEAKKRYKETTGTDYATTVPKREAKKQTKSPSKEEKPASAGPSKNALKKAAKMAKKGGEKVEGATSTQPDASKSPAVSSAAPTPVPSAPSGPLMYLDSDGPGPLKCVAAARLFGVKVDAAQMNPAGDLSFASGCALTVGRSLIFGPNAICRYFSYKGTATADPAVVDEWLEWEASALAHTERAVAEAMKTGGAPLAQVLSPLKYLEDNLSGQWLVDGATPSLADVVVGVTAKTIVDSLGDGEAVSAFPKVQSYVQRWAETDAFACAATDVGEFAKAAKATAVKAGLHASLLGLFDAALFRAWPTAKDSGVTSSTVVKCSNYKHGDFQCNVAMSLFTALKGTPGAPANPMAAASAILKHLPASPLIDSTSVAGGGFINIRLRPAFINEGIARIIRDGPAPPEVKPVRVVVDFSSPNIAKEMHVGHLRSTIIGDSICRLFEFCGHTVLRHNHVGDWGTQFGMLINYMKEAYPNFLQDPPNITDLTTFYKAAKKRFDDSEEFKEASRNTVVELQSGDPTCTEVWTLLCDISRREFQKVYDRLGVTLEEYGESFYNDRIPGAIDALAAAGLVSKDDGADIVRLEHFTYPLIVRKRDGGYGYDSTDMAAIQYRLQTLKCDWVIAITDAGQASHFHMIFDAARAAGWVKEHHRLEHLGFGVVQGEDGKKFKTRSGETVRLVDLLDEAVKRMKAQIQERLDAGKLTTSPASAAEVAAEMGYGAVKYFDLKQDPTTSYKFSYDRMLSTTGNTAIYLQFAHARLASILRKAEEEKNVDLAALKALSETVVVAHDAERGLAFELLMFSDVVQACMVDLGLNRLCEYLYTLATKFTDFVTNCRVLDSPEQSSRLLLCEATAVTMRKCFSLLGMTALYRI